MDRHGAVHESAHLLQNIGDGTFYHSGSLAVRAAVAAGANITYKLLYNSAVAMTGGQQPAGGDAGARPSPGRCWPRASRRVIVTTETRGRYAAPALGRERRGVAPRSTWSRRSESCATVPGVTVLIHDQECATEMRRKRKRGPAADAGASGHDQRAGLRGLRRLRREVQLPVGAAGRRPSSAARP